MEDVGDLLCVDVGSDAVAENVILLAIGEKAFRGGQSGFPPVICVIVQVGKGEILDATGGLEHSGVLSPCDQVL